MTGLFGLGDHRLFRPGQLWKGNFSDSFLGMVVSVHDESIIFRFPKTNDQLRIQDCVARDWVFRGEIELLVQAKLQTSPNPVRMEPRDT